VSYEILNSIYHIRIKFIDVFSLSGGCVSDLKQQLEAVRDRMADEYYQGSTSHDAYESYQAGFNAAIPIILEMAEALEIAECECEISLPVNDFPRDVICHRCYTLKKLKLFVDGGR